MLQPAQVSSRFHVPTNFATPAIKHIEALLKLLRNRILIICLAGGLLTPNLAQSDPVSGFPSERLLVSLAPNLSLQVASTALQAVSCATRTDKAKPSTLGIIDYSRASTERRYWLFDFYKPELLLEEFVAHGRGSGDNHAHTFSNEIGSYRSSLGLYRIGESYFGAHGLSLRLIGLERGFNDKALERAIVMHGADYVSPDFITTHQRLGRSWGCPALAPEAAMKAIDYTSRGQGLLFIYYPDSEWLNKSQFLKNCSD